MHVVGKCEWCGDEINRERRAGQPSKYCKASCRQRAYEQRRVELMMDTANGQRMLARKLTELLETDLGRDVVASAVANVQRLADERRGSAGHG